MSEATSLRGASELCGQRPPCWSLVPGDGPRSSGAARCPPRGTGAARHGGASYGPSSYFRKNEQEGDRVLPFGMADPGLIRAGRRGHEGGKAEGGRRARLRPARPAAGLRELLRPGVRGERGRAWGLRPFLPSCHAACSQRRAFRVRQRPAPLPAPTQNSEPL